MASPGWSTSGGYSCRTWPTSEGMEPRCPGLKSPWAIIRPRASKRAAEKSRPSRTACEYAVLRRAVPASSAIDWSAAHTTPLVIASTPETMVAMTLLLCDVDDEVAVRVHRGVVARPQHDGRLPLLDHRRPRHGRADTEAVAVVHRAVEEPARLREIDAPRALARIPRPARGRAHHHRRRHAGDLELPVGRLERRARRLGVAVVRRVHFRVGHLYRRQHLGA